MGQKNLPSNRRVLLFYGKMTKEGGGDPDTTIIIVCTRISGGSSSFDTNSGIGYNYSSLKGDSHVPRRSPTGLGKHRSGGSQRLSH